MKDHNAKDQLEDQIVTMLENVMNDSNDSYVSLSENEECPSFLQEPQRNREKPHTHKNKNHMQDFKKIPMTNSNYPGRDFQVHRLNRKFFTDTQMRAPPKNNNEIHYTKMQGQMPINIQNFSNNYFNNVSTQNETFYNNFQNNNSFKMPIQNNFQNYSYFYNNLNYNGNIIPLNIGNQQNVSHLTNPNCFENSYSGMINNNNFNNFSQFNNSLNSNLNQKFDLMTSNPNQIFNHINIKKKKNKKSNKNKKVENILNACSKVSTTNQKLALQTHFYEHQSNADSVFLELEKLLSVVDKIDDYIFAYLKGKFVSIIKTQSGSRVFQKYLKNTPSEIIHKIFIEIYEFLNILIVDNYANYFCHKFFGFLSKDDRFAFLKKVRLF